MKNIIVIVIMAIATASHATGSDHGNEAGKQQPTNVTQQVGVKQSARAEARAQAKASARSSAAATGGTGIGGNSAGGTGIGGNSEATGGAASATGGQIVVNGTGSGSGLTGRMVPDVSASSPITSTSCRNGITAGGSGNGWGGLISLFSEDEICELRLLLEQFRTAGQHDKADKLLDGMMLMRCEKLSPDSRKLFGDLCPKPAPSEIQQNAAFSSAG